MNITTTNNCSALKWIEDGGKGRFRNEGAATVAAAADGAAKNRN